MIIINTINKIAPAIINNKPFEKSSVNSLNKPKAIIPKPNHKNLSKTNFIMSNSSDLDKRLLMLNPYITLIISSTLSSIEPPVDESAHAPSTFIIFLKVEGITVDSVLILMGTIPTSLEFTIC